MRKIKRSTKQYIIVSSISLVVLITAFIIAYVAGTKQIKNRYESKITVLNKEINDNKQYTYVANSMIPKGEQISKNNITLEEVFSDMNGVYMTEKDIGKIAVIDIQQGTHIMTSMLTPEKLDNTMREEEFNQFYLNSNLKDNDYIDLRLTFPNGENYIILSKKAIKDINLEESDCFLWLNEEEIVTVEAAIVDAYKHSGSKIYTTKYIEPTIQEASIVNYTPPKEIIDLINKDPNIVEVASNALNKEVRKSIEFRIRQYENSEGMQWKAPIQNSDVNTDNIDQTDNDQEPTNNASNETDKSSLHDIGIEVNDNYAD